MGNVYYTLHREYKVAIQYYSKAIDTNKDAVYFRNRADSYFHLKEYLKSVEDLSAAITLHPDNKNYYASRACAYRKLGMDREAEPD